MGYINLLLSNFFGENEIIEERLIRNSLSLSLILELLVGDKS